MMQQNRRTSVLRSSVFSLYYYSLDFEDLHRQEEERMRSGQVAGSEHLGGRTKLYCDAEILASDCCCMACFCLFTLSLSDWGWGWQNKWQNFVNRLYRLLSYWFKMVTSQHLHQGRKTSSSLCRQQTAQVFRCRNCKVLLFMFPWTHQ